MKTSELVKSILPSFLAVQNDMRALVKDRENPFAGSNYVTLDNILENLKPLLSDNGLILIQNPIVKNEESAIWVGVETKIYHKDGEWIDFGEFLLSFEKGSKMNLAQSAGSLTSYAKRYVLTAVFSISTNEDTDGVYGDNNQIKQHNSQKKQYNNNQPKQSQQQQAPQLVNQEKQPTFNEWVNSSYDELMQLTGWGKEEITVMLEGKAGSSLKGLERERIVAVIKESIAEIKKSSVVKKVSGGDWID
ncbi:ERF family protein [Jeotgalibaca porci]|uniref:ERF family protein n=1 Tax=Jeotgalibaca porci TaxID=1868793 RepID=UPI00359F7DCF